MSEMNDYFIRGYGVIDLVGEGMIPASLIEEAAAATDRVIGRHEGTASYHRHPRAQDAWKAESSIARLAAHPAILEWVSALYRRRAFAFQTLNFLVGTEQRAHQDAIHFDSIPHGFMCGVWVALEDVDPAAGPLEVWPGSQLLPRFTMQSFGLSGMSGYARYEEALAGQLLSIPSTRVVLRQGQAIIWDANLAHGGNKIEKPGLTRRSQVTHYYFEGCRYWTPLLSDPPIHIQWRKPSRIK